MDKPKIIINSHSKEEQFKLILDTVDFKRDEEPRSKNKSQDQLPVTRRMEEFVEQINIQDNNEILTFFIIELKIIDVLFGIDILGDTDSLEIIIFTIYEISYTLIFTTFRS
ncbi:hypothetical protein ACTFIR_003954 [Dictyostelium discoideum]